MVFVNYEAYKNKIGIYCIHNLKNGYRYVGQTKERFVRRFWHHRWKLRDGSHDNVYLQNDWNTFGEECFVFEILCVVPENELDEQEKQWVEHFRSIGVSYNIQDGGPEKRLVRFVTSEQRKIVGEKNRIKLTGTHHSEETKRKMSASHKGKWKPTKATAIDETIARCIKLDLMHGVPSRVICETYGVSYHVVNGILSLDNWRSVVVDGWDEFQKNRVKHKRSKKQAN